MLKKAVQGLRVRAGKTMSKSLGGEAASALAEAKAEAEARRLVLQNGPSCRVFRKLCKQIEGR
jgi:hypothetical protein